MAGGRRIVLVVAAAVLLAALATLGALRLVAPRPAPDLTRARQARLVAALASYARRERLGSFLPSGDVVLAIRQEFLQSAVERSLPYRQEFEDGRYVARLDAALVRLEDGLAEVSLLGRGALAGEEDSPLHVDLILHGAISVVEVDPDSGTLSAGILITEVEVQRAGPRELGRLLHPAARYFSRLRAEDWNRQRRVFRLPIRLQREIVLPELDGDVYLPESRIPVAVTVSAVTALDGRMAVSLGLLPDSASGEPAAGPALAWNDLPAPGRGPRGAAGEERLRARVRELAAADRLWRAVTASDHDVVAVVPESVLSIVTTRVARHYLRGVEVDFRPELSVPLNQRLRVKLLGGRVGAGRIRGRVRVSHLRGRLTVAGDPKVALVPPGDLTIQVPVRVLQGRGHVQLDMEWDPALLVSLVCRGFAFEAALAGDILPLGHELATRVRFAVSDSALVGRPSVQRDRVRLPVDLTDASWAKVRSALVEQDRLLRCGMVMNPDSVLSKLRGFGARGIRIRLPARIFPSFQLPLALEDEYTVGEYRIAARAFDPEIGVHDDYLRFAFRARLRLIATGAPRS